MSSASIAIPARTAPEQRIAPSLPGLPVLPFIPFLVVLATGGSSYTLASSLVVVELIFLAMAIRNPIWVLGAIFVSELTIKNYFLNLGGTEISTRLFITMASALIVFPKVAHDRDFGPRAKPILVAAAGFLLLTTLANMASSDFAYVSQFFRYIVCGIVALFLIPLLVKSRESLLQVLLVAFVLGTASGIAAVAQHYAHAGAPMIAIAPNSLVKESFESWGDRALGLTESPVYVANDLLLILFPVLGVVLTRALGQRGLQLAAITALILALALYFSQTRSWIYAAVPAIVVMAFFLNGKMARDVFIALIIAGGAFFFWTERAGNRYSLSYSEDDSASTRPVLWTASVNIAIDHPVLGVGHDAFLELSPEYANRVDRDLLETQGAGEALGKFTPHNDPLNVWLSFGTFAFILYLAIIWFTAGNFIYATKQFPDTLLSGISLGCLGALIATQVNAFFHNYFDSSMSLWLLAGFSIAMATLAARMRDERAEPVEATT